MHRALAHLQHAVQDTAPLEHVVGEVAVLDGQDGKLRQQRVAVMPVQVAGIETVPMAAPGTASPKQPLSPRVAASTADDTIRRAKALGWLIRTLLIALARL